MKKMKFSPWMPFEFRIGHNYTLRRLPNKYKKGQKILLVCPNYPTDDTKTAIIQAVRYIRFSDIKTFGDWHLTASKEYHDKLWRSDEGARREALEIMSKIYPIFDENEVVAQIFFTVIK